MAQRLRFNRARDVFEAFPEAAEDISAAPTDDDPDSFALSLLESATPENALTFCCYLLPRREAVWWAHQCLKRLPDTLDEADHSYLDRAEDWVREPEEERRAAALVAGLRADPKSPAALVALAAGWTGGSMTEPGEHVVPPPDYMTAKAVNAGVLSTLARVGQGDRAAVLRGFVEMALHLANSS